ncbi:hypothetical protein Dpep_2271 [Dethiosulfovibrio peptidovorans DSM 11002]|uniref:Uncharacterized protein n=1 Tax=Dethiosulfovibrio peptidovorans DSM 11002 TaxID=469381 RepID=D2Z432_9BACT|nr:hypothetical protein Dpep_2271 [Dethiosulfovibrio peptidovorans DSM 11002]
MRRAGFSLVLVLIVLTVGSAFVFTAFYLVENFHMNSSMSIRRMKLYSMAVSEMESMKAWLETELEESPFPLMKYHGVYFASWDEDPDDEMPFDVLIARVGGSAMVRDRSANGLNARTIVYDLVYKNNGLGYQNGLPSRRSSKLDSSSEGMSEREENYGQSGEELLIYLVRTTVKDDQGGSITLEQTVERKVDGGSE